MKYKTIEDKNAPKYWAKKYNGTFFHGNFLEIANAKVTAGFMWAPLTPPEIFWPLYNKHFFYK